MAEPEDLVEWAVAAVIALFILATFGTLAAKMAVEMWNEPSASITKPSK